MRNSTRTAAITLLTLALGGTAWAQSGSRGIGGAGVGGGGLGGGVGSGGGGVSGTGEFSGASTLAEGVGRGQAAVIRSLGVGQLHASEAAVNNQEALRRWLENRVGAEEATNTIVRARIERTALANELRDQRAERFRELRDAVRDSRTRSDSSSRVADARGGIRWPQPLASSFLHPHRTRVEQLFELRSETTELIAVEASLRQEIDALGRTWKSRIRTMHPSTYLAGKRFIGQLERELSRPPRTPGDPVAMNR